MLDIAKAKAPPGGAPIEYLNSPAAPLAAATGAFDAVLCQQGLQFFPDRPAALREMRRVLKPGGRAAIAVWAELDRNQIFAAFHAALRAAPDALADLITAPFSWPSGAALKSAAEDAGFRDVRLSTPSLPMVLEGGVEQAVQSFAATPVSPGVAELAQDDVHTIKLASSAPSSTSAWAPPTENYDELLPSRFLPHAGAALPRGPRREAKMPRC